MAIPSANFAGLRSEISHFDLRSALKDSISVRDEATANMLSTWTEKMTVPVGEVLK
jgi:hypothetical protein